MTNSSPDPAPNDLEPVRKSDLQQEVHSGGEASTHDAPAPVHDSTVGTGTAMALGCIAATVVLVGIGLLYLFIAGVLN